MKQHVFLCILMVGLAFWGCSKDSVPTETPLVPSTSTIISGTVKDSSGNPIDSAAIKIKYYFTAVAKQSAKTVPCSLKSFIAIRTSSGVQLQWITDSESGTYEWEIRRSIQIDSNFATIANIPGAGVNPYGYTYTYVDSSSLVANQSYYYLLSVIDVTGHRYDFDTIQVGPAPTCADGFSSAYPCPFIINTSLKYILASSSLVSLLMKQNGQIVKTLINQTQAAGFYSVIWNGKSDSSVALPSGYFVSVLSIFRNDSTFRYAEPVFVNIVDGSTDRVNSYTDAQGAFTISDIPVDSVFNMKDAMGLDLGNVKVCDSVTVYAVKNGYTTKIVNLVLGKNVNSTIDFILR
ncbi:MAG: hypothetical protein Q7U87_02295 [bacterium]|nr:hypothetical protein [bacterium]